MYLGVDIGSSSSKAVVLDRKGGILSEVILNIGTGSSGPQRVVEKALALAMIERQDIRKCVVTGYGRMTFQGADKQITEISCHAKGVVHELSGVRTIIDVGGQDAKVIKLTVDGKVENFAMNDKCAAGTGRFLEVMARVLDCDVSMLSDIAEKGKSGVHISSTCTVFAESEVISQLAAGKSIEDVALGAHKSIAQKIAGLGHRVGLTAEIAMTGGVALNNSAVKAIEKEIGYRINRLKNPQIMGAMGAALFAIELDRVAPLQGMVKMP